MFDLSVGVIGFGLRVGVLFSIQEYNCLTHEDLHGEYSEGFTKRSARAIPITFFRIFGHRELVSMGSACSRWSLLVR